MNNKSPKDVQLFESHLKMPFAYFSIINTLYPKSLAAVPYNLNKIVNSYHELTGRNMEHSLQYLKLATYGGIPPRFITQTATITGKKEQIDTFNSLLKNFRKFLDTGVILYLHSPYETMAMAAASELCKTAQSANIRWKMCSYPYFVEMGKDFEGDHKGSLSKLAEADLTCFYLVGKEYTTDFNVANFKGLLAQRKLDKKVTVLCSHLSQEDFLVRYGSELCINALEFNDTAEIHNFKALRRAVEG